MLMTVRNDQTKVWSICQNLQSSFIYANSIWCFFFRLVYYVFSTNAEFIVMCIFANSIWSFFFRFQALQSAFILANRTLRIFYSSSKPYSHHQKTIKLTLIVYFISNYVTFLYRLQTVQSSFIFAISMWRFLYRLQNLQSSI